MIGLVSCSARKLTHAAPAHELYCSPLFRLSLAYAERTCSKVYVLSALHGLVEIDAMLDPYEQRLSGPDAAEWGQRVIARIEARHEPGAVAILAGAVYADAVIAAARPGSRWAFVRPLGNMSIGARLQWLSRRAKEAA